PPGLALLLRRAQPPLGAAAHLLLHPARADPARRRDGAGLAATARPSPRRPARCGAARPVRRPAAGTAALGDRAPGRRRRRGGRPRDRTGGRAVTTPSPGHAAGGFPRFAVLMPLWGRDLP